MTVHVVPQTSGDLVELIRLERRAFAAKLRMARAVLGWSQSEFGFRVGMTQRAVHKIEQGETDPRRTTVRAIEQVWANEGIAFEDLADGGFRVTVRAPLIERPQNAKERRERASHEQLGVTAMTGRMAGRA